LNRLQGATDFDFLYGEIRVKNDEVGSPKAFLQMDNHYSHQYFLINNFI